MRIARRRARIADCDLAARADAAAELGRDGAHRIDPAARQALCIGLDFADL